MKKKIKNRVITTQLLIMNADWQLQVTSWWVLINQSASFQNRVIIIFKWANPGLFFVYFQSFFTQTMQFLQQIKMKNVMSIHYMALGIKSMTSQTWVISYYHWTRAPALTVELLLNFCTRLAPSPDIKYSLSWCPFCLSKGHF